LSGNNPKGDFLVSVPLTKKKLKRRGFNQSEEIAREISNYLNIPLITNCLIKTRETFPQVELSEKERAENPKGAYIVKDKEKIRGKRVLLIDDVYTTGSTMEECSRILREAGTKEVWGVVIARG
jgi:ComF family protein